MIKFKNENNEEMDAFLAVPDGKKVSSFVVVIQEIWGLTDFLKSVAQRITKLGFAAVAPDLYSRKGQKGKFTQEVKWTQCGLSGLFLQTSEGTRPKLRKL
jgi:carboxymethylenebutenolidase